MKDSNEIIKAEECSEYDLLDFEKEELFKKLNALTSSLKSDNDIIITIQKTFNVSYLIAQRAVEEYRIELKTKYQNELENIKEDLFFSYKRLYNICLSNKDFKSAVRLLKDMSDVFIKNELNINKVENDTEIKIITEIIKK